jgi:hypothetical protein
MRLRTVVVVVAAGLCGCWGLLHAQKPFQEYDTFEGHAESAIPPDAYVPHEWTRGRLMYPDYTGFLLGYRRRGSWTIDYPRSDRHLLFGVKRLTRIDTRSVEQPVALDNTDDIYNWPMMYAVEVGHWQFNPEQAAQLRDFLDRGGFLMVDDFHGSVEWQVFLEGIKRVYPDREIVDLPKAEPIFHTLYDLDDKYQIPGAQYLRSGRTYEQDGYQAEWKGIYDDKGRVVVAICHNMDLGDSWEHADDPTYPEQYSALGFRIGVNYLVYAMTH